MTAAAWNAPDQQQVHGLPAEVTSFVGRRRELAEVKRLLSVSRLLTLTGVGGVGKTRLALRAAITLRRAFRDGVCLVELAPLENAQLLVQTVAEGLGIRRRTGEPSLEMLVEHLADRQALLILDNCEHLLEECALIAERLVRAAPELRILATSRQPLGVPGEQILAVPTLPLPGMNGGRPAPEAPAQSDAVRLFAERAESVVPGFAITEHNRDAVARICHRLDGIPLGIELAAVRLRALSVEQLLDRLDDRFRLLTTGPRTVLPRQRTLRALIDWSYALCTEKERRFWERVSVFAGGLDLEAAEEVCAGDGIDRDEVVDLVVGLVEKSVLVREDHPTGVRYRLLETIRQYGRARLRESGREAELRRRHRDWYRAVVRRAEQEWFGPNQVAWFRRLHLEHGNLRAALDYSLGSPEDDPGDNGAGLAIATGLRFYWIAAGFLHEGRRWLDRLLAAGTAAPAERAHALCVSARLAVLQSDFAAAHATLAESRELGLRTGDETIQAQADYVGGLVALIQGDLPVAADLMDRAVARHRALGLEMGVVNALMYLATAHSFLGRSEQAMACFEECLAICESRDEHWFRSYALCVFGMEVWRQGDVTRATEIERESIRLKQPFNDRLGIAMCVEVLAWIAASEGAAERAARLFGAVQGIWWSVGGPLFEYLSDRREQAEARARELLGAKRYDEALRKGEALGFSGAIAYALGEHPGPRESATDAARPSPLTRREAEIAELVARGLSNREIAAALVISQRTAEGHVEHIMGKLGFNSRTQIAAWVSGHQAAGDRDGAS